MKRLILFAHYDKDAIIDPYVIRLLNTLLGYSDEIVFVSDSDLDKNEIGKLDGIASCVHAKPHGAYDFGSWRIAFSKVEDRLDQFDEVICLNDSVFGPIADFGAVFAKMNADSCDFWGLTGTYLQKKRHYSLNSYFMAFRRKVVADKDFRKFWQNIEPQKTKSDVVKKYEFGISDLLHAKKYRSASFCGWFHTDIMVSSSFFTKVWKKKHIPVMKVKLFRVNPAMAPDLNKWLDRFQAEGIYPRELVDSLVRRYLGTSLPDHYHYVYPTFKGYWLHHRFMTYKARYDKKLRYWRFYLKLFGIPVFMMWLPSRIKR